MNQPFETIEPINIKIFFNVTDNEKRISYNHYGVEMELSNETMR